MGERSSENATDIWRMLTEAAEEAEKAPKLVLSIIGDSASFVPQAWPKSVFQRALIETGKSSGGATWIFYRSGDVGVSKTVSDAYNDYSIMERKNPKQIWLFELKSSEILVNGRKTEIELPDKFDLEELIRKQKVPVNMNDKENIHCKGDLDSIEHVTKAISRGIPVIIIKGSGKAADIILDYIESDPTKRDFNLRKQAALLFGVRFEDSRFEKMEQELKKLINKSWLVAKFDSQTDDPLLLQKLVGECVVRGWSMEKTVDKNSENLCKSSTKSGHSPSEECPDQKPIAPCTALRSDEDRTDNLSSLLRSVNGPVHSDLKFTSPASLPLDFFYVYQILENTGKVKEYGHTLLLEALIANRWDYVTVLLDHGVTLKPYELQILYKSTVICKKHYLPAKKDKTENNNPSQIRKEENSNQLGKGKNPNGPETTENGTDNTLKGCQCLGMMWLMKEIDKDKIETFVDPNSQDASWAAQDLCRKLLDYNLKGCFVPSLVEVGPVVLEKKIFKRCVFLFRNYLPLGNAVALHLNKMSDFLVEKSGGNPTSSCKSACKDDSLDDILLWSLYANRPQIAELMWLRGENQLMKGLMCYRILKMLSARAGDVKEQNLSNKLLHHAQLMYKKTQVLLDTMYDTDPTATTDMIDKTAYVWGICSTPLTFAYENFMYDFIAKPASQKHLNEIWYGSLPPNFCKWAKSLRKRSKVPKVLGSPLLKFFINYVLFLLMLMCYSAFVTTSVETRYYIRPLARVFEYYVYVWGAGDLAEEICSCFGWFHADKDGKSVRSIITRVLRHLNNFWNIVDILSYVLLITALLLRHVPSLEEYTYARRMFSLSLLIMYLRFLEAFVMIRTLGPKLIMIKEMLKDLLMFISVMIVVIFGVGFYYHANLWPDHAEFWKGNWENWRIWKVLYYPYWQLYGETFNDYFAGDEIALGDCTSNFTEWSSDPSMERCPVQDWTVVALSAVYMLFSNLLLVNLVIAMFSATYERVTANAENLWRFERYTIIMNYKYRVPSPINLPWFLVRIIKKINNKKKKIENEEEKKQFQQTFQRMMANKVSDTFNNVKSLN